MVTTQARVVARSPDLATPPTEGLQWRLGLRPRPVVRGEGGFRVAPLTYRCRPTAATLDRTPAGPARIAPCPRRKERRSPSACGARLRRPGRERRPSGDRSARSPPGD